MNHLLKIACCLCEFFFYICLTVLLVAACAIVLIDAANSTGVWSYGLVTCLVFAFYTGSIRAYVRFIGK